MKKNIVLILAIMVSIAVIVLSFVVWTGLTNDYYTENRLVKITDGPIGWYNIIVDTETKVMYIMSANGGVTLMVDADGKPLLYEGESDNYD
jgi:hypothetical protein